MLLEYDCKATFPSVEPLSLFPFDLEYFPPVVIHIIFSLFLLLVGHLELVFILSLHYPDTFFSISLLSVKIILLKILISFDGLIFLFLLFLVQALQIFPVLNLQRIDLLKVQLPVIVIFILQLSYLPL